MSAAKACDSSHEGVDEHILNLRLWDSFQGERGGVEVISQCIQLRAGGPSHPGRSLAQSLPAASPPVTSSFAHARLPENPPPATHLCSHPL